MSESRTKKSVINSVTSLLFFGVNIPIAFLTRRFLLQYLGVDILGLQGFVGSVLGMINLAELGIGSAILFAIYKPLHNKDRHKINEIISIQGWLYRNISYFVLVASFFASLFFIYRFNHCSFPLWYSFATLVSFLVPTVLSYSVNYRLVLLGADQKNYKFNIASQIIIYVKTALMWLVLIYVDTYKYPLFLTVDVLGSCLSAFIIEIVIRKEYPWLSPEKNKGKKLIYKHPYIVRKTLQLIFHKLAGVILSNTGPIFIATFSSLGMIGIYGNYTMLAESARKILNALFNSIEGGVGSIIAEGNKSKIKRFFWEYTAAVMFFSSILMYGILCFSHQFIRYWVGTNPEYILPNSTVLLMSIFFFISMTRVADNFILGYGLFRDIWAPVAEAFINIVFSVILGYLWGINGVILGNIISLVAIVVVWRHIFLFRDGIEVELTPMWINYIKHILISWCPILLGWYIFLHTDNDMSTITLYIITMLKHTSGFVLSLFIVYFVFSEGFRDFMNRVYRLLILRRY